MCYDNNARPPEPPTKRGQARGRDITLTGEDGNKFMAFIAESTDPVNAQVLIYPDIRGLHQFYKDLALRFAEIGVRALAIDYFGRTAGAGARDDQFDFTPHVQAMTFPDFMSDVRAALEHLWAEKRDTPTFLIGFCRGGTLALLTGTQDLRLAGLIAFYSGLSRPIVGAGGETLALAHNIRFPVLGLYGGADQGIPAGDIGKLDLELDAADVEHELVIYPGATHSFFDRKQIEFANESADAWSRVVKFIEGHST